MKSKFPYCTLIAILSAIVIIGGSSLYLYCNPVIIDKIWNNLDFESVENLDNDGRCVALELKEKQKDTKDKVLKFYDYKNREFLHLDPTRRIHHFKELRPGCFALFDRSGLQLYSIVIPQSVDEDYYWMGDEVQIIDCVDYSCLSVDDEESEEWMSHDIKSVEKHLVEQYERDGHCGWDLITYVRRNPHTIHYPFALVQEKTDISILTSKDNKVRFYSWDTGTGGTSPNFASYIQYDNGKRVVLDEFYPYTESEYVCSHDLRINGYQPLEGSRMERLYQIDSSDGTQRYLTSAYMRASGTEGGQSLYFLNIVNGKLIKEKLVDENGEDVESLDVAYNIPDWYFTTDGLGWDWVMCMDEDGVVFVPQESESMVMSDRYDYYRYTDGRMRHIGSGAGSWLHPSLWEYECLIGIYHTPTKLIRIDRLENGDYRYASWDKRRAMKGTPELILTGAKSDIIENALVFENNSYQYIVPAFRRGQGEDFSKFIIKKNGRIIYEVEV